MVDLLYKPTFEFDAISLPEVPRNGLPIFHAPHKMYISAVMERSVSAEMMVIFLSEGFEHVGCSNPGIYQ
jgi:hypothetical protein